MANYVYYGKELYHHGIKGQKWGTRRWQNEDGSLTPEGREHYGYGNARERYGKAKNNYKNLVSRRMVRDAAFGTFGRITKKGRQLNRDIRDARKEYYDSKRDYKIAKKETKRDEDVKAVKEYQKIDKKMDDVYEKARDIHNREGLTKKAQKLYDQYEKLDVQRKEAYKKTGRNYIERVANNIKYDKTPERMIANKNDTAVTKKVKSDYNNLTAGEFKRKYAADKDTYAKRVAKYGDPYKARTQKKTKTSKPKREKSEYEKGLTRATIEGGLVGRYLYKKKHSN